MAVHAPTIFDSATQLMPAHVTSIVMAVMGAEPSPRGAKVRELCGTAFPIGPNVCLTAGHVWERVMAFPLKVCTIMDKPETETAKLVKIEDGEAFAGTDVAVIQIPTVRFPSI